MTTTTTEIASHPLHPHTTAYTLSRAGMFYAVGLRQVYFSFLLFAWLVGPWCLLVMTFLYTLFIYYVESVDKVCVVVP